MPYHFFLRQDLRDLLRFDHTRLAPAVEVAAQRIGQYCMDREVNELTWPMLVEALRPQWSDLRTLRKYVGRMLHLQMLLPAGERYKLLGIEEARAKQKCRGRPRVVAYDASRLQGPTHGVICTPCSTVCTIKNEKVPVISRVEAENVQLNSNKRSKTKTKDMPHAAAIANENAASVPEKTAAADAGFRSTPPPAPPPAPAHGMSENQKTEQKQKTTRTMESFRNAAARVLGSMERLVALEAAPEPPAEETTPERARASRHQPGGMRATPYPAKNVHRATSRASGVPRVKPPTPLPNAGEVKTAMVMMGFAENDWPLFNRVHTLCCRKGVERQVLDDTAFTVKMRRQPGRDPVRHPVSWLLTRLPAAQAELQRARCDVGMPATFAQMQQQMAQSKHGEEKDQQAATRTAG